MRICLVSHGFPPIERTGVENYTAALAAALGRAGHAVEVFAPRTDPLQPELAIRREVREGYAVHWITVNRQPAGPGEMLERASISAEFGRFLDREKPEVVHFQHVVKLGVGLIERARERGIPTVYTAHDYYAVCHRYTLLRPDLSNCDVRGDYAACGRCDLALGYLNGIESLGDYHMGVLPDQLGEEERAVLAGILEDRPEAAGIGPEQVDAASDLRRELDARRARAFEAIDRFLAPTHFLAEELVRGGVERERIEVLGYGIENADLKGVPPVRLEGRGPRFAFLGGITKQKGVHVLIEAWRRAAIDGELSIWGDSTDDAYVDRMRAAANAAGALWRGPYEREDLPGILTDVDVVVVPSIWVENQPLVIREAFSAGRPVVASDFGALPESVRDGVDGLLFERGNADELALALRRLDRDRDLVERLAGGVPRIHDIDTQALELVERYEALASARTADRARPDLPPSLARFVERRDALAALPARELFRRSLHGLERLRGELAPELDEAGTVALLLRGLESGSRVQTLLRDTRREVAWLHETTQGLEKGRGALDDAFQEIHTSFEDALAHLQTTELALHSTEESLQERERQIAETEAQFRTTAELGLLALRTQQRVLSAELMPLLEMMAALTSEEIQRVELPVEGAAPPELLDAFRGRIEALESLRQELDWRRDLVAQLDQEASWRREQMEKLQEEVEWRRVEMKRLETELEKTKGELAKAVRGQEQVDSLQQETRGLQEAARDRAGELERLRSELEWRRARMQEARASLERGWLGRMTPLGRAVSRWDEDEGGAGK